MKENNPNTHSESKLGTVLTTALYEVVFPDGNDTLRWLDPTLKVGDKVFDLGKTFFVKRIESLVTEDMDAGDAGPIARIVLAQLPSERTDTGTIQWLPEKRERILLAMAIEVGAMVRMTYTAYGAPCDLTYDVEHVDMEDGGKVTLKANPWDGRRVYTTVRNLVELILANRAFIVNKPEEKDVVDAYLEGELDLTPNLKSEKKIGMVYADVYFPDLDSYESRFHKEVQQIPADIKVGDRYNDCLDVIMVYRPDGQLPEWVKSDDSVSLIPQLIVYLDSNDALEDDSDLAGGEYYGPGLERSADPRKRRAVDIVDHTDIQPLPDDGFSCRPYSES